MIINFITTNKLKFQIAENSFRKEGLTKKIQLIQRVLECPEIQDESVENVALYSAKWASKELGKPVITADTGFYIEALGGFPGPFIKYANQWLSQKEILKMMEGQSNRKCYFCDALAYVDPEGNEKIISSKTYGKLIKDFTGTPASWTIDSLFLPDGYSQTLSELSEEERKTVWNKERWKGMAEYLLSQFSKN